MKTIFKYEIEGSGRYVIHLPVSAHVVLFGADGRGVRCLWVEQDADPNADKVPRSFKVYGTGSTIEENDLHHGSYITPNGYVWHLYECF